MSTPPSYLARSPPVQVQSSRDILDAAHGRSGTGLDGNSDGVKLAEPVALDFDAHGTKEDEEGAGTDWVTRAQRAQREEEWQKNLKEV